MLLCIKAGSSFTFLAFSCHLIWTFPLDISHVVRCKWLTAGVPHGAASCQSVWFSLLTPLKWWFTNLILTLFWYSRIENHPFYPLSPLRLIITSRPLSLLRLPFDSLICSHTWVLVRVSRKYQLKENLHWYIAYYNSGTSQITIVN